MMRAPRFCSGGSVILATILCACNGDNPPPAGPEDPDTAQVVASIEMRPPQLYMDSLGFAVQTHAVAYDEDGRRLYSSAERPERFSWSSSAAEVANVDQTGSVRSEDWGATMITATHESEVTGAIRVRVQDAVDPAWSIPAGTGSIQAGVTIGVDGTIYVGTSDVAADRISWNAVSPQGAVVWTLDLPLTGSSTPAVRGDGTLYIGSRTNRPYVGRLIAVDPAGTIRWVLQTDPAGIVSSPALGPDGTIYVAGGHYLYAVHPQGEIKWTYATDAKAFYFSSPAIGSDGTVYIGGADDLLYAISSDGSLRWTFKAGDMIESSPTIGADGTIYFGSRDGRLYAVQPDGTERWSVEIDPRKAGVFSSPSIGPDGTIYVASGGIFAVGPAGSIRWKYPGSHRVTTPIVGADGTVYVAESGVVTALDSEGRLLWNTTPGGGMRGSAALGVDGTILVGAHSNSEGILHAFVENGSTNGGFEAAAWPTGRGNRANTGRSGGEGGNLSRPTSLSVLGMTTRSERSGGCCGT